MIAPCLKRDGCIGLCSPSHVPLYEAPGAPDWEYKNLIGKMRQEGFRVVTAKNFYESDWGYLASDIHRAEDLNQLAGDEAVEYILFGGGEGSPELLPYLDFELFRKNPKRISSYSDGTTLLNAIWAKTGLETYYGQTPGLFAGWREYDRRHFEGHILSDSMTLHEKSGPWLTLTPGVAEGTLVGGYLMNFCLLLGTKYFPVDLQKPYILFLEDHEKFSDLGHVSALLAHLEQSEFMGSVKGLLFGHYSARPCPELYARLKLLGERNHIPAAYCDDFGHGDDHAVLPIGRSGRFDTISQTLEYF